MLDHEATKELLFRVRRKNITVNLRATQKYPSRTRVKVHACQPRTSWRLKQEDPGVKGSLSYIVKVYLKSE